MKNRYIAALTLLLATSQAQAQSLDDCRRMALENNNQMKISGVSNEKAAYDVKTYRANFLPRISASGSYLYTDSRMSYTMPGGYLPTFIPDPANPGSLLPNILTNINGTPIFKEYAYLPDTKLDFDLSGSWTAGIKAEQPIYMGGKIAAAHRASKIGQQMTRLNGSLTRTQVVVEVDRAYWSYLRAGELLKTALKYRELVGELLRNVGDAVDVGMKSRNDLLKVRVKLNQAELNILQAENGLKLARMNLCHIVGLPLDSKIELPDRYEEAEAGVAEVADLTLRPEYGMAARQVELKDEQTKIARSEFLPEAGVMAGLNYGYGVKFNGSPLLNNTSFSAVASIKIPIFNGSQGRNKVRSAQAQRQIAALERDEIVEKMELELTQAKNAYEEARLESELTVSSLTQAEENMKISRDHYDAGMETLADHLQAQANWQGASTDAVNAKAALRMNETLYLKAAGKL